MTRIALAASLSLALGVGLGACESTTPGGADPGWGLGPGYVSIGENRRFGVSYLPDQQAAMLTFTLVGSFSADEQPPEPPVPEEWRAAAEEAAPDGCTVASLEQIDGEQWRVEYDCD